MFDVFITIFSVLLSLIALLFSLITLAHLNLNKIYKKFNNIDFSEYEIYSYKSSVVYTIIKRLVDIIVSLISLIILYPILVIIVLSIKSYDNGPVLIKQKILGKNCNIIKKYKFRTTSYEPEHKGITPIGKVIKSFGMQFLPIYFNILIGNMTLIGLWNNYTTEHINDVKASNILNYDKPGLINITVFCSDLYTITPPEMIKYDQYYLANRSLKLDMKILIMCLLKVFE